MKVCVDCGAGITAGIFCDSCGQRRRAEYEEHPENFGYQFCKKCKRTHLVKDKCKKQTAGRT